MYDPDTLIPGRNPDRKIPPRIVDFINNITNYVVEYYKNDLKSECDIEEVKVVWECKTLQNRKAILSVPIKRDMRLFEFTHNGDRNETYMDVYVKIKNEVFGGVTCKN